MVTGCGKPGFFSMQKPIFEVQTDTGLLRNTDGGTPMTPIGARYLLSCLACRLLEQSSTSNTSVAGSNSIFKCRPERLLHRRMPC